jgi:thiol-disulfide isomerase/thioredoxin
MRVTGSWPVRLLGALSLACMLLTAARADVQQSPAPDFALQSRAGEVLRLSELRGEVVMINFWASWCGPCRQEMPILDALYQRYKSLGFTILGVNVEENPAQARAMLNDIPVTFPVLFDSESTVSRLYAVDAMPSTVLVDRDGNIRYLHRGYRSGTGEDYQQQVRALIRE